MQGRCPTRARQVQRLVFRDQNIAPQGGQLPVLIHRDHRVQAVVATEELHDHKDAVAVICGLEHVAQHRVRPSADGQAAHGCERGGA